MALRFFYSQLFVTPPALTGSYTGQTVIVTGSNVGLGLEAARTFTRLGADTVILAVRSLSKGEAAKRDIEATTGRKDVVRVMQLDMASYQSVLDFAAEASKSLPRIDIAILNAGVARGDFESMEKDEGTITVNVVSTFLLAFALIPKLRETATKYNIRPTLTITCSEVHEYAKFDEKRAPEGQIFPRLAQQHVNGKHIDMGERYQTSKLLEVLAAREFCDLYPASNFPITVNYVNPGLCQSELSRDSGWGLWFLKLFLARTTEVGSRTLVIAGSSGVGSHGEYQSDGKITPPSEWVRSEEGAKVQKRVWDELVGKLEGIKKGITKV
ncbi:retinol dehydrogenase 12 [Setomelanomma holmii]|uniref:Retinol dehydrogenase 12 n=1 Tax=Setomelanomma holmii TaxID=210430 RepID=A0A9P4H3S4_9PLEO|nr:retinol dehydrogenase 12 [Setomelanomma holmii]